MFIALKNKVVVAISTTKSYQENGNFLVNDGEYALATPCFDEIIEVETIPDAVEIEKYCYTPDAGFYENPDFVAPPDPEQALIDSLIAEVANE